MTESLESLQVEQFKMQYAIIIGNYGNEYYNLIHDFLEKKPIINCKKKIKQCKHYLNKLKSYINLLKQFGIDTDFYNTSIGEEEINYLEKLLKC